MDVWVNFSYATKYQAEGIFKCFFPVEPSTPAPEEDSETSESEELKDPSQQNLPLPKKKANNCLISFSEAEITELAKRFGESIPENELSVGRFGLILCLRDLTSWEYQVASLQGYLLKNKTRPRECVDEVEAWIIQERETREKLKKEKEKAEVGINSL